MRFDADSNLASLSPWDLTIRAGGADWPTVRPTVGLIARIQALASAADIPATLDLLGQMFGAQKPDFAAWDAELMLAVLSAYLAYFTEQTRKNSQAIARQTLAAIARDNGAAGAAAAGKESTPST